MNHPNRRTLALVLAALLGAAPVVAPGVAAAQGKGHGHGQAKGKYKGNKHFDSGDRSIARVDARRDDRDDWDHDRDDDRLQPARRTRGDASRKVPPGQMPPAGLCRIWIDGVPPGRQPAPTDCATAERNRPSNARVLYGPSTSRSVSRWPSNGVPTNRVPTSRYPGQQQATGTTVVHDPSCTDVNRDGHHDRVLYTVDGRVVRSECR